MAKPSYEVSYNLKDAKTGQMRSGGYKTVVQAQSETNAISEIKKRYADNKNFVVDVVAVTPK